MNFRVLPIIRPHSFQNPPHFLYQVTRESKEQENKLEDLLTLYEMTIKSICVLKLTAVVDVPQVIFGYQSEIRRRINTIKSIEEDLQVMERVVLQIQDMLEERLARYQDAILKSSVNIHENYLQVRKNEQDEEETKKLEEDNRKKVPEKKKPKNKKKAQKKREKSQKLRNEKPFKVTADNDRSAANRKVEDDLEERKDDVKNDGEDDDEVCECEKKCDCETDDRILEIQKMAAEAEDLEEQVSLIEIRLKQIVRLRARKFKRLKANRSQVDDYLKELTQIMKQFVSYFGIDSWLEIWNDFSSARKDFK